MFFASDEADTGDLELQGASRKAQVSIYAVGALKRANVGRDLKNILIAHTFDGRHVSEPPVMRPDTLLGRENERHVTMVARLVDTMDERRSLVGARRVYAVTRCAIRFEKCASFFLFRRQGWQGQTCKVRSTGAVAWGRDYHPPRRCDDR